jgi:hypothetical protein
MSFVDCVGSRYSNNLNGFKSSYTDGVISVMNKTFLHSNMKDAGGRKKREMNFTK